MNDLHRESLAIIKKYPRAIAHMRAQKESGKLGLVFGAGASSDLGFPMWSELIERIAQDKNVKGENLLEKAKTKTGQSQLLFQKYREAVVTGSLQSSFSWEELNARIQAGWRNVVRDALYRDVPPEIGDLKKKDRFLKHLVGIVKTTPLTINYNFDDTLERLLSDARTEDEKKSTRGYRTMCDADIQPYVANAVVYHPNGYVPRDRSERSSDGIVFSEDSFGDQLIESVHGHYAVLTNHYAHTTCLFVGISLEDSTLKHLLRKNSKLYPGHVHYRIRHIKDSETFDQSTEQSIREADFEVYNVVSLFLKRNEIAALGKLLNESDENFERLAEESGDGSVFRFYLTGSVAVGKSTAVAHFRCVRTHDEWLERLAKGMEKDPSKVANKNTIREIDEFVVEQWRQKNFNLAHKPKCGIHVVDRAPLDAFAFTPEHEWKAKAAFTIKGIQPSHSKVELCKGTLILLRGDPRIMAARAMRRNKEVDTKSLTYRQELLEIVYDEKVEGVRVIDTREKTAKEVVKEVGKIMFLDEYKQFNFQLRLRRIEKGIVAAPKAKKK